MDDKRNLLRHFLAAIAYRTQKALRGAPASFSSFRVAQKVRTPHELIHHMDGVLGYARTFFNGGEYGQELLAEFDAEVSRFHTTLAALARDLETGTPMQGITPERLLQGPLADAMTHAGQLAMLRRLAASPVPPENFIYADVRVENLGTEQTLPVRPGNRRGEWDESV